MNTNYFFKNLADRHDIACMCVHLRFHRRRWSRARNYWDGLRAAAPARLRTTPDGVPRGGREGLRRLRCQGLHARFHWEDIQIAIPKFLFFTVEDQVMVRFDVTATRSQ